MTVAIGHREPCARCRRVWWRWTREAFVNGLGWVEVCDHCHGVLDQFARLPSLRGLAAGWDRIEAARVPPTAIPEGCGTAREAPAAASSGAAPRPQSGAPHSEAAAGASPSPPIARRRAPLIDLSRAPSAMETRFASRGGGA